ncbi:MAG: succinate dehydrogenase iron-sulfur subunit [Chloroflexota bacterium]
MQIKVKILRYNPEKDKKQHHEIYELEAQEFDRVLDVLEAIKSYQDGSLAFRRSCAHGICGSCAMRINNTNRLACKTLIKDLPTGKIITIEPLLGLAVVKDLMVDMDPFFAHYREVMPYFINDEPAPERERLQTPAARERFDDTTKCILCAACTTSCPSSWTNAGYLGPAAMVSAHRFIFDDRDRAAAERLKILNNASGVYACHTIYNCTLACPREIQITKAIGEIKKAIIQGKIEK